MKRGSGASSIVIFIIVVFVVVKIIMPKFLDKTGDTAGVYVALTELETAVEDIRSYYFKHGNFTTLSIITFASGFEDNSQKLEFNKPIKYGVLKDGVINYCVELTLTDKGGEYIELKDLYSKSEVCKAFVADPRYENLKKTKLGY